MADQLADLTPPPAGPDEVFYAKDLLPARVTI